MTASEKLQLLMVQQNQSQNLSMHMNSINAMTAGGKKAREVYVGNLAIGMVTDQMLKDFFNTALKGLVPQESATDAVMSVWMAPDMKYTFVEMRTADLATASMALDKVELCGRALNVGRPSGYVAPTPIGGMNSMIGMAAMQAPMSGMMASMNQLIGSKDTGPALSKCIVLENMLTAEDVDGDEYEEIVSDIKEEAAKHGAVDSVVIPRSGQPGVTKAFVKFASEDGAKKASDALGGRTFDGRKVVAKFIEEAQFDARMFS